MKIVSWNIRGRGNDFLFKTRFTSKLAAPDILLFCDTRDRLGTIQWCGVKSLFDGVFCAHSVGLSDGLALFWKSAAADVHKIGRAHV